MLKTQGDNPNVLERAGEAYAQAGRRTDAEAAWNRALSLATDGTARKRLLRALRHEVAIVALVLAVIGIYRVMGYAVTTRA